MTAPLILPAGDSTPGRLQIVEVNLTDPVNTVTPNWQPLQFVESVDLNPDDPAMVDATVFGDAGFSGQDKLGAAWSCAVVLNHMSVPGVTPPAYDPTHNYLENKGVGTFGAANRVQLRFYDFDLNDATGIVTPRGQAYMGYANYSWPRFGSVGQAEARKVSLTFMGKGKLNKIAHPVPAVAAAAILSSVTPNTGTTFAVAGGTRCRILGSGFGTSPTVSFGGTAPTNLDLWSDNEITCTAPAKAAGSVAVTVTKTSGGTSNAVNVTYA